MKWIWFTFGMLTAAIIIDLLLIIREIKKDRVRLNGGWSFTKAKSKESGAAPLAPTNK